MKLAKLGELTKITIGRTPSRGNDDFWDKNKATSNVWLSIADLLNADGKTVSDSKEYITDEAAEKFAIVPQGTLLVSFKLTLGRLAYAGRNLRTNEAIAALHNDEDEVLNDYLYHYLSRFDWNNYAAADQKVKGLTLNKAKLAEIPIEYPESLEEQQRIVARLDAAFERISAAEVLMRRNLDNVATLFQSECHDIFTGNQWPTCELSEYVKFIDYRGRTPKKTKSGMRLITAKNIKLGHLQQEPREYVDPEIYDEWMTRGVPKKGDVLFTTEAPLANVAQLDTEDRVVFAQRCIILQPNRSVFNPAFLKYMLMVDPVRANIFTYGTGTTVQGIKASLLKKIKVFQPTTTEQEKVVLRLDRLSNQTRKLQTLYQYKLNKLEDLRQSLLSEAFSLNEVK